jgi:hypothetical protein
MMLLSRIGYSSKRYLIGQESTLNDASNRQPLCSTERASAILKLASDRTGKQYTLIWQLGTAALLDAKSPEVRTCRF